MASQFIIGRVIDAANRPLVHDLRLNAPDITLGESSDRVLVFKPDGTVRYRLQSQLGGDIGNLLSANSLLTISQPDLSTGDVTLTVNVGAIDHGSLAGLGDDDHPQYPLAANTETISGTWTFSAATTTFNNDIKVNDQILIGSPTDTVSKRLSSQYDHGSTKANWTVHKIVVTDSMTSALALDDRAMEIVYTMSGVLGGLVAGFKYGILITMNEDTSTTDGWNRRAFAAVFNHTTATTGERIAFYGKGGQFVATNVAGTPQWQIDPIPAATASVVQNLATESWADTTVVAVTGTLSRPTTSVVRLNPAGNIILRGILNGGQGNWLWLINVSANTVQISHEDGAATAATDRFLTTDATSPTLSANGSMLVWYDLTTQRWREVTRMI